MPVLPAFMLTSETRLSVFSAMFEKAPEEWRALLDWCRLHGLDPRQMPAAQVIERDLERCRVEYDRYVLDDRGHVQRDPHSSDPTQVWIVRTSAQGETPPMPFPDVILRHLAPTPERP